MEKIIESLVNALGQANLNRLGGTETEQISLILDSRTIETFTEFTSILHHPKFARFADKDWIKKTDLKFENPQKIYYLIYKLN